MLGTFGSTNSSHIFDHHLIYHTIQIRRDQISDQFAVDLFEHAFDVDQVVQQNVRSFDANGGKRYYRAR